MNESIYLVSGSLRRNLKKKLFRLKSQYKMFWFYRDIDEVMGVDTDGSEEVYNFLKEEINEIEKMLGELKSSNE